MKLDRWLWLAGCGLMFSGCVTQPPAVGVLSGLDAASVPTEERHVLRDPGFSNLVFVGGIPENTQIDPFYAHRDLVAVTVSPQTLDALNLPERSPTTPAASSMSNIDKGSAGSVALAPTERKSQAESSSKRRLVNVGRDFTLGAVPEDLLANTVFESVANEYGLDPWTLYALALFETGKIDPDSGVVRPYPYVIHINGHKDYFETRVEAEARIDALEVDGILNYDVGVLQINRKWHGKTVGDPRNLLNVDDSLEVAARILRRSFRASPDDYILAVGRYRGWNEDIARPFGERLWNIRKQLPNPPTLGSRSDDEKSAPVNPGATASLF